MDRKTSTNIHSNECLIEKKKSWHSTQNGVQLKKNFFIAEYVQGVVHDNGCIDYTL